jgi:hypothetical protein
MFLYARSRDRVPSARTPAVDTSAPSIGKASLLVEYAIGEASDEDILAAIDRDLTAARRLLAALANEPDDDGTCVDLAVRRTRLRLQAEHMLRSAGSRTQALAGRGAR